MALRGKMIKMTMGDGAEIGVYHVNPEGERRGGLVLIQEIFGVTEHIMELCDGYAADGYEVLGGRRSTTARRRACRPATAPRTSRRRSRSRAASIRSKPRSPTRSSASTR